MIDVMKLKLQDIKKEAAQAEVVLLSTMLNHYPDQ